MPRTARQGAAKVQPTTRYTAWYKMEAKLMVTTLDPKHLTRVPDRLTVYGSVALPDTCLSFTHVALSAADVPDQDHPNQTSLPGLEPAKRQPAAGDGGQH